MLITLTYCILTSRWAWTCRFSEWETSWSHRAVKVASAGGCLPARNFWSLTPTRQNNPGFTTSFNIISTSRRVLEKYCSTKYKVQKWPGGVREGSGLSEHFHTASVLVLKKTCSSQTCERNSVKLMTTCHRRPRYGPHRADSGSVQPFR